MRPKQLVRALFSALAVAVIAVSLPGTARAASPARNDSIASPGGVSARDLYAGLVLAFEPTPDSARAPGFVARGPGYAVRVGASGALLALSPGSPPTAADEAHLSLIRMSLNGANASAAVELADRLPGLRRYYVGGDRARWRTDVPSYARVRYRDVYPGIDAVYYGTQRRLEFDFVVRPGGDPSVIAMDFDGARVSPEPDGDLVLATGGREIRLRKPLVYQHTPGGRREIEGGYEQLGPHRIRFRLAAYEPGLPLVIDPVVSYATYFGGSASDSALAVAVDGAGYSYVAGSTVSLDAFEGITPDLIGSGGRSPAPFAFSDAFVAKFDSSQSGAASLVFATIVGDTRDDAATAAAVDAGGVYVAGYTNSPTFPTTAGAFVTGLPFGANGAAFVTKLSSVDGTLQYSTLIVKSGDGVYPKGRAIAVDGSGEAYVLGHSYFGDGIPSVAPAFSAFWGAAFLTKLDALGQTAVFSTYLPGDVTSLAVDAAGTAYLTGTTDLADSTPYVPGAPDPCRSDPLFHSCFPLQAPLQPAFGGGRSDAIFLKLDPSGTLLTSSYLGGPDEDSGAGIGVDDAGDVYIVRSVFTTAAGTVQVTRLSGTSTVYDVSLPMFVQTSPPSKLAVDPATHEVYLIGADLAGLPELVKLAASGTTEFVFGLPESAHPKALAVGPTGDVSIAGEASDGFPATSGAFDSTCGTASAPCPTSDPFSNTDAFLMVIATAAPAPAAISVNAITVTEADTGMTSATFTVRLSKPSTQTITVDYVTADGTATEGVDYQAAAGTATFAPGVTQQTISVDVRGDVLDEDDEAFFLNLGNPTNATLATPSSTATILDNDPLPSISIADASVGEGGTAMLTVTLSSESGRPVSVEFKTGDGTAVAPFDYDGHAATVRFNPGETVQTVRVATIADAVDELDETFHALLWSPQNATLARSDATVTIPDDDTATLSIDDVTQAEGHLGTTDFLFTISLSTPSDRDVTVSYATGGGSALAGSDYNGVVGQVTIAAGLVAKPVIVQVNGDAVPEPDETFNVTLSNGSVPIIRPTGTGTIRNDDVSSATGAGTVRFSTSAGVLGSLVAIDESTLPTAGKPAGVTFPFGFFGWKVSGLTPGQSVTVTLIFPAPVPSPARYWKVVGGAWTDLTSAIGSDNGDSILTLTITDGGVGDADGLANGEVSDPGGVGFVTTDTVPPVITCPANISRNNDPGQAGAIVTYSVSATDNEPGVVSVTSSPGSGSFFSLGTTVVNATATDAAGNSASCSFDITVADTEPPKITCPADISSPNDYGHEYGTVSFTVTATDNAPGVIVVPSSMTAQFPLGTTVIQATATDAAGNQATCTFNVTVFDHEPPVVTAPANVTVDATTSAGAVVSDSQLGTAVATDNYPIAPVVTRAGVPAGNLFPVGTTVITYTAMDASGNTSTAQQTVTVRPFNSNTACTVSGAGWIDAAPPKYFAFAVRYQAGWSAPQGGVVYADPQAHQYLQSLAITRLTCAGTHAEIAGTALTLAGAVPFTVLLDDRGARGAGDAFAIQWPGYQVAKPLSAGDVLVRIP